MSDSKYVKGLDADFDKSVEGWFRNIQQADYNAGVADERKRIIELLEERLTGCGGYECETCDEISGIIRAITLIKGEK